MKRPSALLLALCAARLLCAQEAASAPFRVDTAQTAPAAAPIRGQQVTALGPSPLWTLDLLSLYLASDRDGDGLPDAWETAHGLNPDDPADATEATLAAYNAGRDPTSAAPVSPILGTPFRVDTAQTAPPAKSAQLIFRVAVCSGNFICDTGGYFVSTTGSNLPNWFVAQYAPAGTTFTAESDTDGDGLSNYAEFVLGTNPTDPTSRFTLSLTSQAPNAHSTEPNLTLSWNSVTGRTYTVLTRTALDAPWESTPLAVLPGTGSPLSLPLSQDAPTRFYCVQVDFE